MIVLNDLFMVILLMDVYNRGYNEGINGFGGLGIVIGNVMIVN